MIKKIIITIIILELKLKEVIMELVKNIFFNTDRLTPNTVVKISYTGKFFQDDSQEVTIHYGFGENWEGTTDELMTKTDLGYQIEIELQDEPTFNFCIKNDKDEWDNNDGQNYVFNIEKPEVELMVIEDTTPIQLVLHKGYVLTQKIKEAIIKLITSIPKIITGNYKKKIDE